MSRFRCIGGECESSCCTGGWQIGVDREHHDEIKRAMSSSPTLRREFGAKVTPVKGVTERQQPYALMVLQDDGSCGFFGVDEMCGLQKRYGEGVLSDTCTIYPRTSSRSGARLELAGAPSCPEVARQLLLYPDALELDEVEASLFHRSQHLHAALSEHPADPYTRYHDELRNLVLDLLSDSDFPLSTRLSFVAYFATQTRESERELALSRATVQTVQQFSRAFEHSPSFALGLQQKLSATSVISWTHAICLARF